MDISRLSQLSIQKWNGWGLDLESVAKRPHMPQYALPIIFRQEKNSTIQYLDAVEALTSALASALEEAATPMTDQGWDTSVEAWLAGNFRKVVRKGRGSQWSALRDHPHAFADVGTAEVIILQPHPVGEPPVYVKKLQVSGLELSGPTTQTAELFDSTERLKLSIDPNLGMTYGKQMAQMGHGIQLAIQHGVIGDDWIASGFDVRVMPWGTAPDTAVTVTDAGYTEIAPGSETVKAWV